MVLHCEEQRKFLLLYLCLPLREEEGFFLSFFSFFFSLLHECRIGYKVRKLNTERIWKIKKRKWKKKVVRETNPAQPHNFFICVKYRLLLTVSALFSLVFGYLVNLGSLTWKANRGNQTRVEEPTPITFAPIQARYPLLSSTTHPSIILHLKLPWRLSSRYCPLTEPIS